MLTRTLPLFALLAILLTACSGAPLSPTPSPTPVATATASPTVAPSASPTASPTTATPSASPSPSPTELAFTGRIVDEQNGYALTLPDDWLRVSLDAEFLQAAIDLLGDDADAAALADLVEQLEQLSGAGVVLYAFDTDSLDTNFGANLNVIRAPSFGMSLDLLEQINLAQLEDLEGVSDVTTDRRTLPAGEALFFSYVLSTSGADGEPVDATVKQYLLVADTTQYVLTVSGLADDPDIDAEAEAIAESFEILAP